jgi:hypothetical protein
MPIDTSIYGNQQPAAQVNPFAIAMQLQNMAVQRENAAGLKQQRELVAEQRQNALDDRSALDAAVTPGAGLDQVLAGLPGHMHAGVRKQWADADKAAQDANEARAKAGAAEADYMGTLAKTVQSYGYDPQAASIVLAHAKAQGHDTSQLEQQIAQDPSKLKPIVDAMIQASPKQRELMTGERNAASSAQTAATGARRLDLEAPKITADATVAQQVAAGTKGGLTPAQQTEVAHRKVEEQQGASTLSIARTREAREQAKYDQTYGSGVNEAGQALPEDPTARAIAEYRVPPPSARSMASGPGKALMDRVMRLNPSFDGSQFPSRNKMRQAFTSGPQGQALNSLNTAIVHLDQFVDAAKELGNGSFQPTNALVNWVKTVSGSSAPTNFEGIKTIMSGELASAFKKSGATDTEIHQVEQSIAQKQSPAQLLDYATQVAIPALSGKANTYDEQWKQAMGDKDASPVYTPSSKKVLAKYGAQHANTQTPGGAVKMQAPDGSIAMVAADHVQAATAKGAKVIQ